MKPNASLQHLITRFLHSGRASAACTSSLSHTYPLHLAQILLGGRCATADEVAIKADEDDPNTLSCSCSKAHANIQPVDGLPAEAGTSAAPSLRRAPLPPPSHLCSSAWQPGLITSPAAICSHVKLHALFQPVQSLLIQPGIRSLHSSHASSAEELAASNPEATSLLDDQVASCQSLTQLVAVLDQHSHKLSTKALLSAVDLLGSWRHQHGTPDFNSCSSTLVAVFKRQLASMPATDVVRVMYALGRLRINPGGDEAGLQELCAHVKSEVIPELLSEAQTSVMVNLLWAVSEASCHGELEVDEELFLQVQPTLQVNLTHLPLKSISKLASAITKSGNQEYNLLVDISDETENRLKDGRGFDAASFTNITKHLVQAKVPLSNNYLRRLAEHVIARTPGLKLHHVITLAKCFALEKYGDADSEWDGADSPHVISFWESVSGYVLRHRQQLTAQQVQDVMYAYALRNIQDSTLFHVLATRAVELLTSGECKPVNLSILLWACARQSLRHGDILDQASKAELTSASARYLNQHFTQFNWQNLSNSLWGLGTLEHKDPQLMEVLATHIKQLLQDPDGRHGLQVDESSGVERFCVPHKADLVERWQEADGQVLQRIHYKSGNTVVRQLGQGLPQRHFNSQNLTDIAWAYSVMEQPDQELYALISERLMDNMSTCSLISIVDMCWAMSKQGYSHPDLLHAIERHMVDTWLVGEAGLDYLSEVLFAMAKLEHSPSKEFLEESLNVCNQKWDRPTRDDNTRYRVIWSLNALGTLQVLPQHPFNRRIADYVATAQTVAQGQPPASTGVEAAE